MRVAILTVSDRCARGKAQDESGPALGEVVRTALGGEVVSADCVPDEVDEIRLRVVRWSAPAAGIDLVLTTGGTGLAPRDVTPEAVGHLFDRVAPGLMELARLRCYEKTPDTFLSRGVAGTINRTLVLTLPGSVRGAVETLEALVDILPHAIAHVRGEMDVHEARPSEQP